MKNTYYFNAEDYIWVDVQIADAIYACLWSMKHYIEKNPVKPGDMVLVQKNGIKIGEGVVVDFFTKTGKFESNSVYHAGRIPVVLSGDDYVWVRVVPEDFYVEGIDAIWQKLDDNTPKPVKLGDKVEYCRKGDLSKNVGEVVAIGPVVEHFTIDERYAYFADLYVESNIPCVSSFANGIDDLMKIVDKKD